MRISKEKKEKIIKIISELPDTLMYTSFVGENRERVKGRYKLCYFETESGESGNIEITETVRKIKNVRL